MYKSVRILLIVVTLCSFSACTQQTGATKEGTLPETANGVSDLPEYNTPSEQDDQSPAENSTENVTKNVLIFGDSITAGFGLDAEQAFPAILQTKVEDLGWEFNIINGGLSGDTSAGGLRRINWMLRETVDVLVLELGGNDGLRGTSPEVTRQNLQAIINEVRTKNPDVEIILAGMQIPPNLGQDYTAQFKDVFPSLAEENKAHLIPFLLENVGGVPSLNQPDGIHPTAEEHKIVAENVWKVLKPVLSSLSEINVSS